MGKRDPEIVGVSRDRGRAIVCDGAGEFEFTAVPVATPGDLWLVVATHKGLVVYPWGDPDGYVLEGEYFYHDAAFFGDRLRVAATSGSGSFQYSRSTSTRPRTRPPNLSPDDRRGRRDGGNGGEIEVPMITPIVTVYKWTLDELLDGREMVFGDTANPKLGYKARVHVAGGSCTPRSKTPPAGPRPASSGRLNPARRASRRRRTGTGTDDDDDLDLARIVLDMSPRRPGRVNRSRRHVYARARRGRPGRNQGT